MRTDHDVSAPVNLPPSPFRSNQAWLAGLTRWELAHLVATGGVRRVLTDVYVPGHMEDTVELRAACAGLVLRRHAVIVDRSAAWLWGIDVLRQEDFELGHALEVFVLRGHKRVQRRGAAGGTRDLAQRDVVRLHGVNVTTPLRTCLDLACRLPRYEALAAVDAFARVHGLTAAEMSGELQRFRRRRGVVQAREIVRLADPRVESSGESFTRLAIYDEGLPMPQPQHWVVVSGVRRYRLDLAYPSLRICVEYDGVDYHTDDDRKRADERRRAWLRAHGWHVIVVTKDSFKGPERDRWLGELGRAIVERRR